MNTISSNDLTGHVTKELYLVERPFQGYCITTVLFFEDETNQMNYNPIGYSFTDWCRDNPNRVDSISLVDSKGFDALFDEHENSLKTDPKPITSERWFDMLEVLPPCKWGNNGAYEVFHVSERITGNLVSWFAKCGDKHFEFDDDASISREDMHKKLSLIGA